jgi:hypothetical protein
MTKTIKIIPGVFILKVSLTTQFKYSKELISSNVGLNSDLSGKALTNSSRNKSCSCGCCASKYKAQHVETLVVSCPATKNVLI